MDYYFKCTRRFLGNWIPFVFMGCNLIFAVFVFAFLARPSKIASQDLRLSQDMKQRALRSQVNEELLTTRVFKSFSLLLVLLLFLTSCITGGVIAHVRLYEQSKQVLGP